MKKIDFKHPRVLPIFFATEMWERYGFYVVQTLLILYLAINFHWPDKRVYSLVGSFTALAYLSPLIGGWIADHLLGQKRVILMGSVILICSYAILSLSASNTFLNMALAGIAVGTGLLKPNISSLLGNEYPSGSTNREKGFMIFYMGITTGIILGTTLPSYLSAHFGWSFAFLSASLGMLGGAIIFSLGIYWYRIEDYIPQAFTIKNTLFATVIITSLWLASFYILNYPSLAVVVFSIVAIFSTGYYLWCIKNEEGPQVRQTIVLGLLCLIAVLFWAFYFQIFLSLTLFLLRVAEPTLFGYPFPPPYYVGIESIGMIILGLFFVYKKSKPLNKTEQGIQVANKFLAAMIAITMAYLLIVSICYIKTPNGLLSPLYIIPAYLIISLAEILLSPVGLAAVTMFACRKKVSTLMGIFLSTIGIGAFLAGKLAGLTAISPEQLLTIDIKAHYASLFGEILLILMLATLVAVGLNVIIRTLLKSINA